MLTHACWLAGATKAVLMTRLLKHFGLRQPASAPYAVVAHHAEHHHYLDQLIYRLYCSGDRRSSLVGCSMLGCGMSDRQMLSLYGSLEGMLEALETLEESGASRLRAGCTCGSCLDTDSDSDLYDSDISHTWYDSDV